jgi:serine/threonine protein kinase/Tol biopolymer transport system component
MQADRWKQVEELYQAILAKPTENRAAFLLQACPDDPELRGEVQSLLDQQVDSFLESSPVSAIKALRPGAKVGNFEIVELLGRGGMGEVWRARDPRLKRDVAIKVLPAALARDPDRIARFEREARAASALNHPNIVSVHDIGCDNGTYWIASERVRGETLRRVIEAGPLPAPKAIEIATQLAAGLAAAHAAGLVHRDLKPDNIMVARDGHVKILDFGLAKQRRPIPDSTTTDLTDEGMVMGTAGYMSPEQVRGEPADHRSDLFSFGVVLYEMLCGKRAFAGNSSVEVMNAILKEEPPELPSSVPPTLGRIVRRCLEKEPDRRFQSAADLGFALQPSSSLLPPTVVPKRQAWLKWAALASVFVAAIGAGRQWLARPTPPPQVTGTAQITSDGTEKSNFITDGTRIYYYSNTEGRPILIPAKGGDPVALVDSLRGMCPLDISKYGSEMLLREVSSGALWTAPVLGGARRRLGGLVVTSARWSPDAGKIVYTKAHEVHIARSDGTEIRKLATVAGEPFLPSWSPDGLKIRFSTLGLLGWEIRALWEVSADGSNFHALLPDWKNSHCCGNWTPDGKYFVFQAQSKGTWNIWARREKIGLIDRRGYQPVQLTSGPMQTYAPVPSPDGKRIFFFGDLEKGELVRYDAKTRQWSPFLPGIAAVGLDFSRDQKWVTYNSIEGSLWRSAVDGSQRRQLTLPPMVAGSPRWSFDGQRIAFCGRSEGSPPRVFVVPAEGGAPVQVTTGEGGVAGDIDPTWSPDGSSLAFSSFPPGDLKLPDDRVLLRVVDLNTHRISVLPGSRGLWSPRWSPDGRYIAALLLDNTKHRLQNSPSHLVLYDCQKGLQIMLFDFPSGYPNWSQDGQFLYFRSNIAADNWSWYRMRIRDRKLAHLFTRRDLQLASYTARWTGLTPDGSLLLLRGSGTRELYALDWEAP